MISNKIFPGLILIVVYMYHINKVMFLTLSE